MPSVRRYAPPRPQPCGAASRLSLRYPFAPNQPSSCAHKSKRQSQHNSSREASRAACQAVLVLRLSGMPRRTSRKRLATRPPTLLRPLPEGITTATPSSPNQKPSSVFIARSETRRLTFLQLGVTDAVARSVPQPYIFFGLAGALPYLGSSLTTIYLARQAGEAATGGVPLWQSQPADSDA